MPDIRDIDGQPRFEALLGWLTEVGCTHVAMEATGVHWKPVWHILSDGAFELIVANAAHIKNVPGRKTDVNDATWIAECGRRPKPSESIACSIRARSGKGASIS